MTSDESLDLEIELEIRIATLKNCEKQLEEKWYPGMFAMKVFTMEDIGELNRKLYSKKCKSV